LFLQCKKGLILLLFAGIVAGIFFAVKDVIIEGKPNISSINGARPIGTGVGAQGVQEVDRNGDGKTDIWRYLENGVVSRSEVDSDYDGNIDYWAYYKNGRVEKQEIDRNNDGMKDAWAYLEQGLKVRQEVDSNHDGKVDTWFYYKLGKLCGRAMDTDFDGKIDEALGEVPFNKDGE